jgi:hypothetical protein
MEGQRRAEAFLQPRGSGSYVDASDIPIGIAWGILEGRRLGWRRRQSPKRRST